MDLYLIFFLAPLLASAFISLHLLFNLRRRDDSSKVKTFSYLMICIIIWCLAYSLQLWSVGLSESLFWAKFRYFGIVFIPVFWFIFALQHAKKDKWLSFPRRIILMIPPVISLIFLWTNQFHNLFYGNVTLVNYGVFTNILAPNGPVFWLNVAYAYILLLLGACYIINEAIRTHGIYQKQAIILIIGVFSPFMGNIIYNFGLSPFSIDYDLTPISFFGGTIDL